jgi:hypothetical protein
MLLSLRATLQDGCDDQPHFTERETKAQTGKFPHSLSQLPNSDVSPFLADLGVHSFLPDQCRRLQLRMCMWREG